VKKLSKEAYKGTRDFYPEDMRLQNYIFATMKSVVEKYGYEEYTASILEESDLYRAKTGEEIVNEQTYSFIDRGGRDVTLRPEMTPTVARMVANKRRALLFPLRWYSIPNCFRYERPQRGRLREFWQLNVDLLGTDSLFADAEIIKIAYDIMDAFGADPKTFVIKINNRKLMNEFFTRILKLNGEKSYRLSKFVDKKSKVSEKEFKKESESLVGNKVELLNEFLRATTLDELPEIIWGSKNLKELRDVMNTLNSQGVKNCIFDPTLMRGFDYYTGIVFEIFDLNPLNNRSLFGGGRYDNLVDLFGVEPVPIVGFGMGDLTMQTYLETYNLKPKLETKIDVIICMTGGEIITQAVDLATVLRKNGVTVVIDYTDKKMGQKIKNASKKQIPFVVIYGPEEVARNEVTIKMMKTGKQKTIPQNQITNYFKGYNEI